MKFGGGLLGFENGIIVAPMGPDIAGPELVAAVADAGGIGLLASPVNNYEKTVKAIRDTKKLTDKPFGAGILLEFENSNTIKAIYDEKLPLLQVYWGDFPKERVDEAHRNGVKVIHQVGSVEAAERAIAAGVDCIIAQGLEAGGHIAGTVALTALVPRIVDLVGDRDIPVVAAGSISDAHGYVAALALGAKGICVGTRFIATNEAYANEYYKQQLLHYTEQQTDRTDLYGRLTWRGDVRCLNTPFHEKWRKSPDYDSLVNDDSQPTIGHSTIYSEDVVLRRFAGQAANPTTDGQLENMVMYAGQGVGLVNDIVPAGEVIRRYIDGAKAIIQQLGETYLPEASAPSLTVDREEKEDEDDEDKDRKVRPLVPNDNSTEEPQAVPTPTFAAAEFTKRISSVDPKDEKSAAERDRHGSNESSSHRVQEPNDVDRNCRRDEYKEINADRDRELEHAPDKHTAQVNKNLLVAKQLIDMIPRTKDELFCYEINWAVYDKHQLHERIRPWISKKVIEFLGEEETTLVDYILSKIKDHVRASELLELLVLIVDDEAEMFVFRLWRIIIFEIKKVEIGIAPKLKA